jgi:hypothetical protein
MGVPIFPNPKNPILMVQSFLAFLARYHQAAMIQ